MTPSSAPPLRCSQPSAVSRSRVAGERSSPGTRFLAKNVSSADAAVRERLAGERLAGQLEHVERHELGGCLAGQLADAALGRMKAELQRVERQRVADRDDQLAVEQEVPFLYRQQHRRPPRGSSGASGLPDFEVSVTSSPRRRARQRKPSHLGSNCQPSPSGSSAASSASIGASDVVALSFADNRPRSAVVPVAARIPLLRCRSERGGSERWHSILKQRLHTISTVSAPPLFDKAHRLYRRQRLDAAVGPDRCRARHLADRSVRACSIGSTRSLAHGGEACASTWSLWPSSCCRRC